MGWFSSNEKSAAAVNPVNPDITQYRGSGAEQDRYGDHFSKVGEKAGEKIREKVHDITHSRGSGAEQDRLGQHLGVGQSGYNAAKQEAQYAKQETQYGFNKVKSEAESGYNKAKSAAERALHASGSGAEQDRFGSHLSTGGLDPVRSAALDIIGHGGDVSKAGWYGLGHDGWERAKFLAAQKGTTGSEQVLNAEPLQLP